MTTRLRVVLTEPKFWAVVTLAGIIFYGLYGSGAAWFSYVALGALIVYATGLGAALYYKGMADAIMASALAQLDAEIEAAEAHEQAVAELATHNGHDHGKDVRG